MTGDTGLLLTAENSCPPPVAPLKSPVPPVTWKVVSMRRPTVAQSSWCEWMRIVPLAKVNTSCSSTMLQGPLNAGWPKKSSIRFAWKEPGPVDRLLLAFATAVDSPSVHGSFRHLNDVKFRLVTARWRCLVPVPARAGEARRYPSEHAQQRAERHDYSGSPHGDHPLGAT